MMSKLSTNKIQMHMMYICIIWNSFKLIQMRTGSGRQSINKGGRKKDQICATFTIRQGRGQTFEGGWGGVRFMLE